MKIWKTAAAVLCAALLLTGCSNQTTLYSLYREVENLELIKTIGVDSKGTGLEVTVSGERAEGEKKAKTWTVEAESLAQALDKLKKAQVGKELVFSHAEHIVLSEEVARKGISGILDYTARASDIRFDINLFIVQGAKAKEMITETEGENTSVDRELQHLEKNVQSLSMGYVTTCCDVAAGVLETGHALVMAVKLTPNGQTSENAAEKMISPSGYAVIQDHKLQCFLTGDTGTGTAILMNHAKYEGMQFDFGEGAVFLGVRSAKTKITPVINEEGVLEKIGITVEIEADIIEVSSVSDVTSRQARRQLARLLEERERERLVAALEQSRTAGIDYLNLGKKLEMKAPLKAREMAETEGGALGRLPYTLEVTARIVGASELREPIGSGDEKIR